MANFNSKVADRFVQHAIDLEKFKAGQRNNALRILKKLEQDLVIDLSRADLTRFNKSRLQALLQQTRATIESAYKTLRSDQLSDWQKLMRVESDLARKIVNRVAGVDLLTVAVSDQTLRSLLSDATVQGGPAKEWWNRQAADTFQKFGDVVRGGMLKGSPVGEIVADMRSAMNVSARNAEALIRTGINSIATDARLATFQENDDVISAIQQHSTLDARTTDICKAYSGATYTNDDAHEPLAGTALPFHNSGGDSNGIPRHWGCRSYWVPVVRSLAELAGLGKKPPTSAGVFEQKLKDQGILGADADQVIANAQASMDGQVADTFTYEQWLKTKSETQQLAILGPTKFQLWKSGAFNFTQLVDESGRPMTVDDLKKLVA